MLGLGCLDLDAWTLGAFLSTVAVLMPPGMVYDNNSCLCIKICNITTVKIIVQICVVNNPIILIFISII
jgi:hypothetical protein